MNKILVIDDQDAVPHILETSIDWMWVSVGGVAGTIPEVLVARSWANALRLFEANADELVGVVTDALIEIDSLNRAPDEHRSGTAFFWLIRRFSAQIPVVIYSMGGLNEYLMHATGMTAMPPAKEGNWRFLPKGMSVSDLSWLEPMVALAHSRVS